MTVEPKMFCSVLFSHQLKLKFHLSERLISQILDYKHRYHGKIKDCHWLQINNTIKVIKYSASIQAYTYRSGQTFDPSISSSTCILLKSLNNVDDAGKSLLKYCHNKTYAEKRRWKLQQHQENSSNEAEWKSKLTDQQTWCTY